MFGIVLFGLDDVLGEYGCGDVFEVCDVGVCDVVVGDVVVFGGFESGVVDVGYDFVEFVFIVVEGLVLM